VTLIFLYNKIKKKRSEEERPPTVFSTTKNYGKDSSTTPMVKPQLPSLLAMIGYPINLDPLTHTCKIILANLKKS
jgi:hypothetical protein